MELKKFVVKKYIMAKSAADALKKEKKTAADDVWIDEKWMEEHDRKIMGFK